MADCSLTLICPPAIEEKLLDILLERMGNEIFTSTPTHSHGSAPGALSAHEQVMGRSRAVQVQVLLTGAELDALREVLHTEFAGTGLRYWITAVVEEGDFA